MVGRKANPQKYSPKSVIAADEDNPLQIVIDTGIKRDEPVEADYTNIDGSGKTITYTEEQHSQDSDDGRSS